MRKKALLTESRSRSRSPLALEDGEQCPCPHGQPQLHRGEEGHQRVGRAHRRQGVAAQKLPHNQRVGDIVALLQQIPRDHGQHEQEYGLGDVPPGQVPIQNATPFLESTPLMIGAAGGFVKKSFFHKAMLDLCVVFERGHK